MLFSFPLCCFELPTAVTNLGELTCDGFFFFAFSACWLGGFYYNKRMWSKYVNQISFFLLLSVISRRCLKTLKKLSFECFLFFSCEICRSMKTLELYLKGKTKTLGRKQDQIYLHSETWFFFCTPQKWHLIKISLWLCSFEKILVYTVWKLIYTKLKKCWSIKCFLNCHSVKSIDIVLVTSRHLWCYKFFCFFYTIILAWHLLI